MRSTVLIIAGIIMIIAAALAPRRKWPVYVSFVFFALILALSVLVLHLAGA